MRHGYGLIKPDKETHSILYGQECHKIGRKLGCNSPPGTCKIAETLILNQVCTVTVPDTHSIGDIMLQKLIIKGLQNNS